MIQITLTVKGKERQYRAAGMNLRASLDAYELYKAYSEAGGDYSAELTDKCIDFICRIFGRSFSTDELLDGYKGSAYILIPSILRTAVGYVNDEIVNFPEPAKAPEMEAAIARTTKANG